MGGHRGSIGAYVSSMGDYRGTIGSMRFSTTDSGNGAVKWAVGVI